MTRNSLLILNIILIFALISIAVIEKYPSKIYYKITPKRITDESFLENWRYQQQIGLYEYYHKKGNVVMFGNSITYRVNWNELLNRGDIINRGIESDITEGYLARMEYIYNVNPKLCFVMGGANDLEEGVAPKKILDNLYEITIKLKERNIKPILFSALYTGVKRSNYKAFNHSIKLLNEKIKEMCANNAIEYIDLNVILSENDILQEDYSSDGIHLTGLGYKKWGEVILPIIEQEIE